MAWIWGGMGSVATIDWGGRTWTLDLTAPNPGLLSDDIGPLLALDGLAAPGRRDPAAFTGDSLQNVERRFGRIEATYMPAGWADLKLRASWGLHGADSIDLEIQISAHSVDELRQLEVIVASLSHGSAADRPLQWVEPRDARSAALTYDGREPMLDKVITLPPVGMGRLMPRLVEFKGSKPPIAYLELAHPDDVTRRITERSDSAPLGRITRHALFGYDLERGVVLRGRLRAAWIPLSDALDEARRRMAEFLGEPPPLGP